MDPNFVDPEDAFEEECEIDLLGAPDGLLTDGLSKGEQMSKMKDNPEIIFYDLSKQQRQDGTCSKTPCDAVLCLWRHPL